MSFSVLDLSRDVANIVTSVNEVVSISSSISSTDANVKFYSNISSASYDLGGYWQTVYDSSPTSSLSTPIFDLTFGYASSSTHNLLASVSASQNEKVKIYRQMASSLLGNPDSLFTFGGSEQAKECFFLLFKRGISKDELKKGTTELIFESASFVTASDVGASTNFRQTIGGDYSPLSIGSTEVGQVWYNAGVIVLSATGSWSAVTSWSGSESLEEIMEGGSINNVVDGLRSRVERVNVHNQTNLYSSIYFCRATNSEFNYSSNPTFVDDNKRIRVTSGSNVLQTRTYITTIGLYDENDNLLATGKVNKPITKAPDIESVFRIRLDF